MNIGKNPNKILPAVLHVHDVDEGMILDSLLDDTDVL